MKILVLGGTGAIGARLVQILSTLEFETVVTSRKNHYSTKNVKYIKGNALEIEFIQSILEEHWDAIVDFLVYTTENFNERVSYLLDATKQYIFISSARVYSNDEKVITEKTPRLLDISMDSEFLKTDEYSLAKARQEDILHNSGKKNWTIIRPYITYSENRLQLGILEKEEWLYRAMHGRTIVFSQDIKSKITTLTHGLDVARGVAALIGNPEVLGETFHISMQEKDSRTWNEILEIYLSILEKYLGYKPKVLFHRLEKFKEYRPKSQYQIIYDRLYNRVFDNSKINQFIEVDSFVRPEMGLTNCLKSFLQKPEFENINWQMEAKKDLQAGEKTPLKEIKGLKQKMKYFFFRYCIHHL